MEGRKYHGKLVWETGTEKRRTMTVYQWRCTPEEKAELLKRAAEEKRTANKVLSDALAAYLSRESS